MSLDEFRNVRIAKADALRASGVDPYPASTKRSHAIRELVDRFDELSAQGTPVTVAGRVMAQRIHGVLTFWDVDDGSDRIQVLLKEEQIGVDSYRALTESVDLGDIVEATGPLMKTKRGERSVAATGWSILTKALVPLPEKWHGLQDVEERYRRRYLDLLLNSDVRKTFETRNTVVQSLRRFLQNEGFLEVQTPVLQPLYGGASARPFKTHMHALDIDMYLRIAPELYLKRLIVGGMERVYEFTTNFRNEGMDRDHNPEFSVLEFYAAYRDLAWAMEFTERLLSSAVVAASGGTTVQYEDATIQFGGPYARTTFCELFREHTGLDFLHASYEEVAAAAQRLNVTVQKSVTREGMADEIFKKVIRKTLVQPVFVTDWPAGLLPLAKRSSNPDLVQAFQFFAGGFELIKAFGELNDPIDQRERMGAQEANRAKGDEEAQRLDEEFLEALEHGMPPTAGWGLGIDRFVMLLTGNHSIRDVILFPTMKPRDAE